MSIYKDVAYKFYLVEHHMNYFPELIKISALATASRYPTDSRALRTKKCCLSSEMKYRKDIS